MNASHGRRLAKLERERRPEAEVFYVWRRSPPDTSAQAIARRFPDGVPACAQVVVVSWQVGDEHKKPGG